MNKIRKGDEVIVMSGRDKGKRGTVVRVMQDEGKVVVENVNMVKRHSKGNPMAGTPGGIIEKELPLPICKVALWNAGSGKGDRIGFKQLEDGRKVRFFKSNNEVLDS